MWKVAGAWRRASSQVASLMNNDSTEIAGRSMATPVAWEGTTRTSGNGTGEVPIPAILSFDVEEHHRIESAVGLDVAGTLRADYHRRMCSVTHCILERLAEKDIPATFFVLGQIAEESPSLVRSIHDAGHEVASHGWGITDVFTR